MKIENFGSYNQSESANQLGTQASNSFRKTLGVQSLNKKIESGGFSSEMVS